MVEVEVLYKKFDQHHTIKQLYLHLSALFCI